jgi:hypothetical protein
MKEIINRVNTDSDGVRVVENSMFFTLFECDKKQFFILTDIWSDMEHPFSNKDIRGNATAYGLPFDMWCGENHGLVGIPCLGTHFYSQEIHCWDYEEVARAGWTKSFYHKVVKALYKRYDGYYGNNAHEYLFVPNDDCVVLYVRDEGKYSVHIKGSDIYNNRYFRIRTRKALEAERKCNDCYHKHRGCVCICDFCKDKKEPDEFL